MKIGAFILRRALAVTLIILIAINFAMATVGVVHSATFFSQRGALAFVLRLAGALLVYAIAIVFVARSHEPYWDPILRTASVFGVLTGSLEVLNVGIENEVAAANGPILSIGFMLLVFVLWGVAGFRSARTEKSIRSGLLAAVCSVGICMLIAVAAGLLIQLFLSPPEPGYVSTWAEFKRSGWTDASAFVVANTLDSGFSHLILGPMVAVIFGGIGSLLARFTLSKKVPVTS